MSDFHDFIEGESLGDIEGRFEPKCSCCTNPLLSEEIGQYTAGRQDGSITLSVWQIWKRYFRPQRGVGSPTTLETHIKMHMGIDL